MPRWYKGFRCGGSKPEVLVKQIAEYVTRYDLGHLVPVVRIEKRAKPSGYYLFLAIESAEVGQIPERVQSTLLQSKSLGQALDQPFTFDEIRPMVGAEHSVHDNVRLIPYVRTAPSPIVDPFDERDERTTQQNTPNDETDIRTQQYDRLLGWLSAAGQGNWQALQQTWQLLGGKERAPQMLRHLRLLGHIETSADRKRWAVTPSTIFPITHGEQAGHWVLCGQRDTKFLLKLQNICKMTFVPQMHGDGPVTVYLHSRDPERTIALLHSINHLVRQEEQAGLRLARLLPPLNQWKLSLESLQGIRPHAYCTKIFNGQTFIKEIFSGKRGLYELWPLAEHTVKQTALRPEYTLYYDEDTQRWLRADWYGLRFLARYEAGQSCPVQYGSTTSQFAVPLEWRWPELYERALVLASGRLPRRQSGWLIYDGVGRELVDALRGKLRLDVEESFYA